MAEQDLLKGVTAALATTCILLLSLPALKAFVSKARLPRGYGPVEGHYEDEDGVATEESIKAYSDLRPRIAVWLSLLVGLGASISSRVLALRRIPPAEAQGGVWTFIVARSGVVSWSLICLQAICLPLRHQYLLRFRLTIYGLLSCLILASIIAWKDAYPALGDLMAPEIQTKVYSILSLVQLAAAASAACAFAGFPRRPDVFDNGSLVDQQHTVSLLKRLSYSYNMVVFDIAKERQMKISDLPVMDHAIRSRNLTAEFLANCGDGKLWRQLLRVNLFKIAVQWILTIAGSVLSLFPQLVLYKFLQAIESRGDSDTVDPYMFVWAFALLLSQAVGVGFQTWSSWFTISPLTTPVMSLLQSLIFSKAMRQYDTAIANQDDGSNETKDPHSAEKMKEKMVRQSVINHMQLDSSRVTMFFMFNSQVPLAFTNFFLAGTFLVRLMGWKSVLAGVGAAAIMAPFSTWFSKSYSRLTISLMMSRDSKANLLTEALQGMRQIKYSGLERLWEDRMLARRKEELDKYRTVSLWGCLLIFLVNLGPVLLACVTFSVYAWQNGTHIKASVIFTSLDLLNRVSGSLSLFPMLQMFALEAWTSCMRLDKYLSQADREQIAEPGAVASFEKATVAWPKAEDADAGQPAAQPQEEHSMLRDISLEFPTGKLSVITGKTGSGKSLLLAAILGEVKLVSGSIHTPVPPPVAEPAPGFIPPSEWIIPSSVAFVSQTPWIESGTVKENITFGLPFDESRYNKVLHACALEKDIEHLVDGEQTQVGPKGVTLSGGQRWRLALARALYSRAGIVILDDVLSAVDSHVGRVIVDEGLTGELAKGRTRILATHHSDLVLPHASYLIKLRDGWLESAEEVSDSGISLLDHTESNTASEAPTEIGSNGDLTGSKTNGAASSTHAGNKPHGDAQDEKHEAGRVKWRVYKAYYKASGAILYWTFGLGMLILARLAGVTETWALKELSETASSEGNSTSTLHHRPSASLDSPQTYLGDNVGHRADDSNRQIVFWLGLYVVLHILGGVLQAGKMVASLTLGLRASQVLFQRMTHAVLRAPLRWTDTTPAGRILNRFTSDMSTIDARVSRETLDFISTILGLVVIIGTSLSVSPWILFFGIILVFFYINVASKYVIVAREVNRINATSNSPVYDQFSSVLSGLSTIRAFGRVEYYINRMYSLIDNSSKANLAKMFSALWLSFRLGMLGVLFVTAVAYAVAVGGASAALAGFSLTFAFQYSGALGGLLQAMTSFELGFNAVERVLEYAEIETEPEDGADAPAAWPAEGRIEVDHLTVSYAADLPDVLHDLNFTIEAGERIGVVGRTGAGKSTLAAVLFRLIEPKSGSVRIDNIDISTLKLDQLRSRLAIIPQDPFLFSGTLRSNLDMEGLHDDYELLQALQRVHLVEEDSSEPEPTPGNTTPNIFTNLSHPISSGGSNLSQGQRQLVCLARALLRRPKLIVLDEATSAVDRATDAAIQASLRREFAGSTVLVVAHRLSTVADFDRLLVLDGGRVAEVGGPGELLRRGMDGGVRRRDGAGAGAEMGTGGFDGAGAFWELVQRSAERERLVEMILGKDG
ncbi:hypothetical protein CONLIGDRAFT_47777 [Coniochaeta ligniaria NRRL 30616]|uniref:P-loop containing nucleoside triphosphate hydrolase protein n=1 Tax=Coniochaeta ligniaria NRRL 30616 TaxID=1408157 RepID=A0A1J7JYN0_9PEZI|nr:hypothetical protein CONLIGDRAFT_47777 [Coniochaeta ligniaria NRRL 30616]